MKQEAQRIAIAEACGWEPETRKMYAVANNVHGWGLNQHLSLGCIGRKFYTSPDQFPDYLNDLNDMREALSTIRQHPKKWTDFKRHIRAITLRDCPDGWDLEDRLISATANQLAEAFLKTIGKL